MRVYVKIEVCLVRVCAKFGVCGRVCLGDIGVCLWVQNRNF